MRRINTSKCRIEEPKHFSVGPDKVFFMFDFKTFLIVRPGFALHFFLGNQVIRILTYLFYAPLETTPCVFYFEGEYIGLSNFANKNLRC